MVSSLSQDSLKQTFLKGEMTKRKGFSCWVISVLATEQHVRREEICHLGLALMMLSVMNTYHRGQDYLYSLACSDG